MPIVYTKHYCKIFWYTHTLTHTQNTKSSYNSSLQAFTAEVQSHEETIEALRAEEWS